MKVLFKRLNPNAQVPEKAYDGDFCYDVRAVSCEELAPNVYKYGLGFALAIDRDDNTVTTGYERHYMIPVDANHTPYFECAGRETDKPSATAKVNFAYSATERADKTFISNTNLAIDLRARSSVWKTGMVLANSVGTVDEGYRNELAMIFYHVMPGMPKYEVGDKIGQMKIGFTTPIEFEEVDELPVSKRNLKGFGSSGK